jgi:hypothetical protein
MEGRRPNHIKNSTPTRQVQILGDFFWGEIKRDFVETQVLPLGFHLNMLRKIGLE